MSGMIEKAIDAVQEAARRRDNDVAYWHRDAIKELVLVVVGVMRGLPDEIEMGYFMEVWGDDLWRHFIDAALKSNVEVG